MAELAVELQDAPVSGDLQEVVEVLDRFADAVIEGKSTDMCGLFDSATQEWSGCGTVNEDISPLIMQGIRKPDDLVVVEIEGVNARAVFKDYRPTVGSPSPENPGPQSVYLEKKADAEGVVRWLITGFSLRPA